MNCYIAIHGCFQKHDWFCLSLTIICIFFMCILRISKFLQHICKAQSEKRDRSSVLKHVYIYAIMFFTLHFTDVLQRCGNLQYL